MRRTPPPLFPIASQRLNSATKPSSCFRHASIPLPRCLFNTYMHLLPGHLSPCCLEGQLPPPPDQTQIDRRRLFNRRDASILFILLLLDGAFSLSSPL
ncbi:hypothetical protein K437DRAFT_54710 [Tilletiaria anomala UBC 951]|uniref:Uncharacterized protein n=1 Tax=Tilletiaria anomala (strain ATCC 24038 / CBS 436.72 / UBC 951) TaxID=1037660 RepID=A0A066VCH6_TILAU|nr:uncharacterized protein K437DRAFT_54710 [Tilletiaria anomala UBC 951]KDN36464.1 hypothetical protein K437DRAFT_54710 [Tilletiaria anomala UBC 951]